MISTTGAGGLIATEKSTLADKPGATVKREVAARCSHSFIESGPLRMQGQRVLISSRKSVELHISQRGLRIAAKCCTAML